MDDAQSAYSEEDFPFWEYIVKEVQVADVGDSAFVVIVATCELVTYLYSSPAQFKDLRRVHAKVNCEEVDERFPMFPEVVCRFRVPLN